jgi:putative cell wall-binding protein
MSDSRFYKKAEKIVKKANIEENFELFLKENAEKIREKAIQNGEDLIEVEEDINIVTEKMRQEFLQKFAQKLPELCKKRYEEKQQDEQQSVKKPYKNQ